MGELHKELVAILKEQGADAPEAFSVAVERFQTLSLAERTLGATASNTTGGGTQGGGPLDFI